MDSSSEDKIYFDIENEKNFILYAKEGIDSEDFADIIYLNIPLQLQTEFKDILLGLLNDLEMTTKELSQKDQTINRLNQNLKDMCQRYDKLVVEEQKFKVDYYDKVIHLLNTKKQFIQENLCNVTKASLPEVHNDSTMIENDPVPSSSTQQTTPTTKHSAPSVNRTPTRSTKRTPSKRLREIQDMSDSDDSFTVFTCHKSKLKKAIADDSLNSSQVFKNFKMKTPVKVKEFQRDSSVELKIEKEPVQDMVNDHDSESGSMSDFKPLDDLNAQKMDIELEEEEIPCSQELDDLEFSVSYTERKRRLRSSKSLTSKISQETLKNVEIDPYNVDTINILNSSE